MYLFFAKEMTLEIKIIICRWTIMLMGGRKCISRAILSHNLYFYHVHNVTSYFVYSNYSIKSAKPCVLLVIAIRY